MASPRTSLLAAVLLPAFLVLHSSSSLPSCPQSCICENAPLLNCSSSGLSVVPRLLQGSVSELDLSHNLLSSVALHQTHYNLRNVWLGNNSITYLSLCLERNLKDPYDRHRFRTRSRLRCQTWAPALQLLSAERNLLEQLPEGLDGVRSLQVLQLSFNRISTLQPGNLSRLRQLKELHLKHNLITHLHPQMFQGLDQLRVLDLSFNMVTSLHPLMYLTFRSIGTDVQLGGNRWWCNCSMRSLQRRMAYDSSKGLQAWTIVCAFPSTVSGRDLLQLQEEDFDCLNSENSPDLHQDVTVYSGSEILLSCSAQDSVLWTPSGEGSVSQQNAGLLISDVSHSNTGLYVCVSEEDQVVSVFNLQISKTGGARKARSLPETHNPSLPQNTVQREGEKQAPTQSDLALAVCLSIFITFLLAFILGVLARPCIDVVWKRITNKKSPSATHTVSSTEQGQYDNEAFSNVEEQLDPGPFRERRVTFSTVDFIEDSNVQYYDTVASGDQDSITSNEVIECEVAETEVYEQNAGDSGSLQRRESKQSNDSGSDSNEQHVKNTEFEHIPDPSELQERISLSSSSDLSSSDPIQQRLDFSKKPEVTQSSMEGQSEMPGFSHTNSLDFDALQDNEDIFEFSDFSESPTGRSSSIFETRRQEPTSDEQKMEDVSSSSSYISEDEPTHYTVNSDRETDESDTSEASVRGVDQVKSSFGTKRPAMRPHTSFSSDSSDSDEEPMQNRRKPNLFQESQHTSHDPSSQFLSIDLRQITQIRRRLDFKVPSPSHDSSFSSDSEDETKGYIKKQEQEVVHTSVPPITVSQTLTNEPENQWPSIDLGQVTKIKRSLDIKAPSASDDSPSSSKSEQETTNLIRKQEQEVLHMSRPPIKLSQTVEPENQRPTVDLGRVAQFRRRLDIKPPSISSDSSLSSDSEDETKRHIKYEEQKGVQLSSPSNKASQPMAKEPGNQWPIVDLGQITQLKRRINIKAPSPRSDSSSNSESEDETTGLVKKEEQEEVHTSRPPIKVSQTVTKESENHWPTVDLGQMTQIRRRIDFKARSPSPDSSSSSDSEDKTKGNINYQIQEEVHMTRPPIKVSQTVTKQPENQWPTVDLGQIRIKRRLDIKVPSQSSHSSSSSDSEKETKGHMLKLETEEVHITRPPIKVSQTVIKEPENQWPTVDLGQVTQIKRRLDFKAPSQSLDSSSSSDSEDETTGPIKKLEQEEVHTIRPPIKISQTVTKEPENQWPTVDLGQIRLNRRLDFKAPSQSLDSSSSSDSEDETTGLIKNLEQEEVHTIRPPIKVSQTVTKEPENQWPTVDLGRIRLNRRLDFKAPSQSLDLSSSSDSEDETAGPIKKLEQEEVHTIRHPIKVSQTVTKEPENQWPTVDLGRIRLNRRLDFKAPSQSLDLSSSSDSEDETAGPIKKLEQEEVHTIRHPIKVSRTVIKEPGNLWPIVDLVQVTQIKRRLDFKAPSKSYDSSSSSDSEDETTGHIKKLEQEKVHMTRPPINVSQTVSKEPENQWPTVDLGNLLIKRRLDFKVPSQSPDSSSGSDSEDEIKDKINNQLQEEVHMTRPSLKVSQTITKKPENQWPTVDLGQVTQIKRRLDFKAPSQSSDASSSNENEKKVLSHIKKQEQEQVHVSQPPSKLSQTVTKVPENQWPTVDLGQIRIKRRLDIKAPSQSPALTSSSDSRDETTGKLKKLEQEEVHMTSPPIKVSQTVTKEPENQWPTINMGQVAQIKRRLDFKVLSQSTGSSLISDSENETKGYMKKQEQEQAHLTSSPIKAFQIVTKVPKSQWPTVDLGQVTQVRRRLDFKAPSLSSDSFESEEKSLSHIKKQEQEQVHVSQTPSKLSQTVTKMPENQWPTVDLGQMRIKRRLNFKAPSQSYDSFESEEKTKSHIKKQEQEQVHVSQPPIKLSQTVTKVPENQWPTVDLGQLTQIKRRLDFKAPSQRFNSYSSNENKEKTIDHIKKQDQEEIHMSRPSINVSQTVVTVPENQWPIVDLGQVTQIKRRLDFKVPSSSPCLSSSSDTGDETKGYIRKQEQEQAHLTSSPIKAFQVVTKVPKNQWPTVDLRQVTQLKRRLDFKAPSQRSDSFSSNESEEKVLSNIKKQEQEQVHVSQHPSKLSQTVTKVPENQWPTVDLGQIRIKRRLDIKAPSQSFDTFSSNENKDKAMDRIKKQEKEEIHMSKPATKVSQTAIEEPGNQWPIVDLGQVTQIKRRLDFKALSSSPGSSSSSDSEEQTKGYIKKQEQEQAHLTSSPIKAFQVVTKVPKNQWPTVDLGQVTQIKRRLAIKAPSQSFESFTIENNQKAMDHVKKQEQEEIHMIMPSIKVSQTVINEPENQWPIVYLGQATQIKRRLDFKVPSSSSESSRSYGYEDKPTGSIKRQEQEKVHMTRPPINISQTVTKDTENHWPSVNLGGITKIKRRLDIKALSLGSLSSRSENENEKDFQAQTRVEISAISTITENNVIRSPEVPVMNIVHTPRKDYNIKLEKYTIFSDDLESKPIYDTINATPDINPELQSRWATMNLGISRFRKRLEITSPSTEPANLSSPPLSSSSDTDPGRRPRLRRKFVGMQETDLSPVFGNKPLNVSVTMKDPHDKYSTSDYAIPSVTGEEETKPDATLNDLGSQHAKWYEDIWVSEKVSASSLHHPHSSYSSDSKDETINLNVPDLRLGVPRIKRRLNIKAPSLETSNAPSFFSKSEKDVTGYGEMQSQQISTELEPRDESLITYKRSIIKGSSLSRNSFPPSGKSQTVDHTFITQEVESDINASLVSRSGSSMTFDDIVKSKIRQSRANTDVDLPHEIRWTGVGHHLPDLSTSKPEKINSASSLQRAPITELHSPSLDSSSSTSVSHKMQGGGESDATLMNKYSSLSTKGVSPSSGGTLDVFGISLLKRKETPETVSEDRGRRGLGALKAMSQERRTWETDLGDDPSASSDHYDPKDDTRFNSGQFKKDIDVLHEEALKDLPSPSLEKTRDADLLLLYGVPRYRGHGIKDPTQESLPPVPETPPPDD